METTREYVLSYADHLGRLTELDVRWITRWLNGEPGALHNWCCHCDAVGADQCDAESLLTWLGY